MKIEKDIYYGMVVRYFYFVYYKRIIKIVTVKQI